MQKSFLGFALNTKTKYMTPNKFIQFCLQLRNLASLRNNRNRKSCLCCGFENNSVVSKQICLLLNKHLGGDRKDFPDSNDVNIIVTKAEEIFPGLEKSEREEMVFNLIFD